MVATEGTKNLQAGTIKNIGAAWVLTLPVTIIISGFVYYVLQMIFA
jgi:PiT family inorganic phosphate transporter